VLTPRRKKFAEYWLTLGNATRAAREAGFSEKNAASQGSILLRDPEVIQYIESKRVRSEVYAEIDRENLRRVGQSALVFLQRTMSSWQEGDADARDMALAIETARRAQETLGKMSGLFVEKIAVDVHAQITLQGLLEKAHEVRRVRLSAPDRAAIDAVFTEKKDVSLSASSGALSADEEKAPAVPGAIPAPPPGLPNSNGDSHAA
jgi:phage terminase small subunit